MTTHPLLSTIMAKCSLYMTVCVQASQLMGGCHLPPLYVGVECSLLNNTAMCERFLARAAALQSGAEVRTVNSTSDYTKLSNFTSRYSTLFTAL
jgi:hypothetical protein